MLRLFPRQRGEPFYLPIAMKSKPATVTLPVAVFESLVKERDALAKCNLCAQAAISLLNHELAAARKRHSKRNGK